MSAAVDTEPHLSPAPSHPSLWPLALSANECHRCRVELGASPAPEFRSSAFPHLDGTGILHALMILRC